MDMSCLIQWWRIMFSLGIGLSHPTEYFFCQFLPVCSSCSHPHHHACFLRTVMPCCLQRKRFALSLPWGPARGALAILRPVLVRPLLRQAHVNKSLSFRVCLYALVWWWWAFTTISFPLRLVWTCQLLCWCNSKPLYAISTAFLQCRHENCHLLHLKCYERRPFIFLPLTTYLKY